MDRCSDALKARNFSCLHNYFLLLAYPVFLSSSEFVRAIRMRLGLVISREKGNVNERSAADERGSIEEKKSILVASYDFAKYRNFLMSILDRHQRLGHRQDER